MCVEGVPEDQETLGACLSVSLDQSENSRLQEKLCL